MLTALLIVPLLSGCLANTKHIKYPYPVPGPTRYIDIPPQLLKPGETATPEEILAIVQNRDWFARVLTDKKTIEVLNFQLVEIKLLSNAAVTSEEEEIIE